MTWTRHLPPPNDPHVERSLNHADPFAIVFWSPWSGLWATLTDHDTEDTSDLAGWCAALGLPVPTSEDQAWAKGESE